MKDSMKVAGILSVLFITLLVLMYIDFRHNQRFSDLATKQHEFCLGVKEAMRQDRLALESGDPKRQEAAASRFFDSQIIYHGSQSIAMCTSLPQVPVECQLNRDWSCLARIAKSIGDQL